MGKVCIKSNGSFSKGKGDFSIYNYNEIPKYRKKRKKKKNKRSSHKHVYKDMLIKRKSRNGYWYNYGQVCEICGRIGEEKYFETEEIGERVYRFLTQKEILEKYKDLPIFEKK